MSKAQDLANVPDKELLAVLTTLADTSRASQSTAVHERQFDDGSRLAVTSVAGSDPVLKVTSPPEAKPAPAPAPAPATPAPPTPPIPPIQTPPAVEPVGQLWPRPTTERVGQLWPPRGR